MSKKILILGGAILVLGGAVTAYLLVMPGGGGFTDLGATPLPPPPEAKPPPVNWQLDPVRGSGGSAVVVTEPGPVPTYEPSPPPPPPNTWEAVKPSAKLASIGPAGAFISRGLAEMKEDMAVCFDEEVQSRHGQQTVTRTRDAAIESEQSTILMLQLESHEGTVVLVDAPVEAQGPASDGLVACAQKVLRGLEFQVPGMKSGKTWRVPYTLSQ